MARVLVVDDDSISCQLLGEVLQHDGLPVLWATDPFDALERVRRNPVDLAILDMRMPQMNGLELMRRLRGEERFGSVDELVAQMHHDVDGVRAEPSVWR